MALQPFTWGFGGQQITSPEQAARQRAIAESLIARSGTPASNWGEGLADVAAALTGTVLQGRAADAETAGRERAAELYASLMAEQDPNAIMAALASTDAAWGSDMQNSVAKVLLEQSLASQAPNDPWAGVQEVNGQLIQMTPEGPVVLGDYRDQTGGDTAREQEIARLQETGLDRITAINIADGRWIRETNPLTGQFQVMDMATGLPVNQAPEVAPEPQMSQMNPEVQQQFGDQFSAAPESFGVGGAGMGAVNTVMDAIGVGAPYPEVQQTQADFGILRESLLNDIASSYGRQPPSWLLQEIRNLTPAAGSPFEGAGQATSKLNALGRHLENEIRITQESLQRELSPTNRQELESRLSGLTAGLSRVTGALASFGGEQAPAEDVGQPPEGVAPELWQIMTPEERALWQ